MALDAPTDVVTEVTLAIYASHSPRGRSLEPGVFSNRSLNPPCSKSLTGRAKGGEALAAEEPWRVRLGYPGVLGWGSAFC